MFGEAATTVRPVAVLRLSKHPGSLPVVFHGENFVSERYGFVYHCVPKAMSRSMLEYLASVDPDGYRVADRQVGKDVLRPPASGVAPIGFSVVRNPYSRIVAVWFQKFLNYCATPPQRRMFARYENLHPGMSFSAFIDWLATDEGNDAHADPHWLSQHYFLFDVDGNAAVDYVAKVEDADEDIPELQSILGFAQQPFPHLNSNATSGRVSFDTSRRWREVLDDRSTRVISTRYDGDFELFGYERLPYRVAPYFTRSAPGSRGKRALQVRDDRRTTTRFSHRLRAATRRLIGRLRWEARHWRRFDART